jgi:hypothetical protein
VEVFGIADGVCNYNIDGLNTKIHDDVVATLEEIKKMVADKTLVLPTDLDQVDAWAAQNTYKKG